jgi:protein TonB
MDQARTTIRAAVSRVKKEDTGYTSSSEPAGDSENAPETSAALGAETFAPEPEATSADANADQTSSLLTQYEVPSQPPSDSVAEPRAFAAAAAAGVSSLPQVPPAAPAMPPASYDSPAAPEHKVATGVTGLSKTSDAAANFTAAPAKLPGLESDHVADEKLSEDPVMAELERAEAETTHKSPQKATPAPPAPVFSAYSHPQKEKSSGVLVALLVMVVLGGGLYASWMYVPAFRVVAEPAVNRVLDLAGVAHSASTPPPAAAPAKPSAAPVAPAATTSVPAPQPTTDATTPAANAASPSATPADTAPSSPPPSAVPQASGSTAADAAPQAAKSAGTTVIDFDKAGHNRTATRSDTAQPAEEELAGEKSAVILSSKGAEKRLLHSVQPHYPARSHPAAQGTMVLKVVIDATGKVAGARLVEGDAALASTAIKAVKQWRYRPYVRNGETLPFQTIVLIDFQRP